MGSDEWTIPSLSTAVLLLPGVIVYTVSFMAAQELNRKFVDWNIVSSLRVTLWTPLVVNMLVYFGAVMIPQDWPFYLLVLLSWFSASSMGWFFLSWVEELYTEDGYDQAVTEGIEKHRRYVGLDEGGENR